MQVKIWIFISHYFRVGDKNKEDGLTSRSPPTLNGSTGQWRVCNIFTGLQMLIIKNQTTPISTVWVKVDGLHDDSPPLYCQRENNDLQIPKQHFKILENYFLNIDINFSMMLSYSWVSIAGCFRSEHGLHTA